MTTAHVPKHPLPTLGRIVHYVLGKRSNGHPVVRPAIVVDMCPEEGTVGVQVFTAGDIDDEVLENYERSVVVGPSLIEGRSSVMRGRASNVVLRRHARHVRVTEDGAVILETDRWYWPPTVRS